MTFSLDHLQPSPENQGEYVTEVLSGKLNLHQKEFIQPAPLIEHHGVNNAAGQETTMGPDIINAVGSLQPSVTPNGNGGNQEEEKLFVTVSWIQDNNKMGKCNTSLANR